MIGITNTTPPGTPVPYFWPLVHVALRHYAPGVSKFSYGGHVDGYHFVNIAGEVPDAAAVEGALTLVGIPPRTDLKLGSISPGRRASRLPDLCPSCNNQPWFACRDVYYHQQAVQAAALRDYGTRVVRL